MDAYITELTNRRFEGVSDSCATARLISGGRNPNDVEFLLLVGSDPSEPTSEEVWKNVYGESEKGCCYICAFDVKRSYYCHNGEIYFDTNEERRSDSLISKHQHKGWSIRQLIPNTSRSVYNYQVICATCYVRCEDSHLSCYHQSILLPYNTQAKREAVTTLLRALEVSYLRR